MSYPFINNNNNNNNNIKMQLRGRASAHGAMGQTVSRSNQSKRVVSAVVARV